jgi:hypothetical protein
MPRGRAPTILTGAAPAPYLRATDDEIRLKFAQLETRNHVADILEVSPQFLRWILFVAKSRRAYTELEIPKRHGGSRRICIPPKNIRILQDKLLRILSIVYRPRDCVTGFVKGRSILGNARAHLAKRVVLSFDLLDFFPSIHLGRIKGALQAGPYELGADAALVIAQIASHADGHLPQGAPTSPILANIVCGPFDTAMMKFAQANRIRYTRYADDITISTTRGRLSDAIARIDDDGTCHLGPDIVGLVEKHGFRIRDGKTRLRHSRRRQITTGVVVNEFPNVPKEFRRELRSLIHWGRVNGLQKAAEKYAGCTGTPLPDDPTAWILGVISGKLAYLRMIRGPEDPTFRRFLREANQVSKAAIWPETPLSRQSSQPLRRRTRRNVNWALWAERYSNSVFRLICVDPRDEVKRFGTGFRVGPECFLTAGHNVYVQRREEESPAQRELSLELPLQAPIPVTRVLAIAGEFGKIDLALAKATVPTEWPRTLVPTQERLPGIGEEIAALGYPEIAQRHPGLVLQVGRVESVSTGYGGARFITVSFACGPGLSGSPLLDANGYCVGVISESTYKEDESDPKRAYGHAIAIGHWRELEGCSPRLTTALDT